MKSWIGPIAGFVLGVVIAAPAYAVPTASLTINIKNYSGKCPVVMKFAGKITSDHAYTNVVPTFTRSDGTKTTQPALTIFAAGSSVAVQDSMNVASSAPNGFDRLSVAWTYVEAGQIIKGTATAQASFTVTCTEPGGVSDFFKHLQKISSAPNLLNVIARPTNLRTTNNPQDCPPGPLGAVAIACGTAIQQGQIIFMWDWAPGQGPPDITGYHLYRLTPQSRMFVCRTCSGRTLVATQDSGPDTTVKPAKPLPGCYVVRAYKGSDESVDSRAKCIGAGATVGTKSIDLDPAHVRSTLLGSGGYTSNVCSVVSSSAPALSVYNYLEVGYNRRTITDVCDWEGLYFLRGGLWFNMTRVQSKSIWKATLFLHADQTLYPTMSTVAGAHSCAVKMGAGAGTWWIGTLDSPIDGDFVIDLPQTDALVTVDVTSYVRGWIQGGPNYGLVFKGPVETVAFVDDACDSTYSATLHIDYFQ